MIVYREKGKFAGWPGWWLHLVEKAVRAVKVVRAVRVARVARTRLRAARTMSRCELEGLCWLTAGLEYSGKGRGRSDICDLTCGSAQRGLRGRVHCDN